MSLLRLTAKVGADATQFHSTVKGVEVAGARLSRQFGQQLKSGLLYFFGFSGFSRLIRGMADMIDRADELKPRFEQLGIVIDDALIQRGKEARAQWEAVTMGIKAGLLPTFTTLLHKSAELLLVWTYMAKQGFELMNLPRLAYMLSQGRNPMTEFGDNWQKFKQDVKNLNSLSPLLDPSKDKSKITADKAVSEAIPKITQDSLAKIGGFTGRAGEELKSIQFRQLSELRRIQSNTEPLKRGIT